MIKSSQQNPDEVDRRILALLQEDGRMQVTELAKRINLSPASALKRMRALEEAGYIPRYTAIVDREKLGFSMLCYMQVSFQWHRPEQFDNFLAEIRAMPEVLECHKITGEYDYLLKILVRGPRELEQFHNNKLTRISGVARTLSHIVLSDVKSGGAIPV